MGVQSPLVGDPDRGQDLLTLLGLPRGASPSWVRFTYEQQVGAAVRAGDTRRAVTLSRAFDDLPLTTRREMYAGAGTSAPRLTSTAEVPRRPPTGRRARVRSGRRTRASGRARRVAGRAVVYVLGIPMAVVVGVAVMVHLDPSLHGGTTTRGGPPVMPPVTIRQVPTADPGWWQVPVGTPAGPDGRVQVLCRDAGGGGQTSRIAPGQLFTCPSGLTPVITGT